MVNIYDAISLRNFRRKQIEQGLNDSVVTGYLFSLVDHIGYVHEAGRMIGVDPAQLDIHDQSKFSDEEFPWYASHFHGGGSPKGFAYAWLHHMNHNPHHWQYWIFPDGFTPKESNVENGVVRMPDKYALEMIADWMGASKTYTGSWDMAEWLDKNAPRIRLHSLTKRYVIGKLSELGYKELKFS